MPRDTLTREQIVGVAIDLLDMEGLGGLNMRLLGNRLGSAATAVYWHVGSKGNLIALAGDQVWGELALPDLTAVAWRAAATTMATDLHRMLTRHHWLVQAFGIFPVFGPGKARHDDHSLAVYEAAGFVGAQADQAVASVFTFVLGNALGAVAAATLDRELARGGSPAAEQMRDRMASAREIAAQFPRLRARLDTVAAVDYAAAPDNTFEFGLRAILDGLASRLAGGTIPHRAIPEREILSTEESLERLRGLFIALPGVTERISHGEPAWFAKKQIATFADHHHDDRVAFHAAAPDGAQERWIAADQDRFFRPPYVGGRGWIGVYLDVEQDWDDIAEIVDSAYQVITPSKPRRNT